MNSFKTMVTQLFTVCSLLVVITGTSCNNAEKKHTPQVAVEQPKLKANPVAQEPVTISLKDTGQQFFTVTVLKNNQPYISYKGDFPAATFDGDNFTLQLAASKRMLAVSHLLVLYFNGIGKGVFPVVNSGNEKGKPTLIFTPEKDGNYGINISADSGSVTITNYNSKSASGKCVARGKDSEGNDILIKAEFINVKNIDINQ